MVLITRLAQLLVAETLQHGDIAIDATAGNGHDTQFLLNCVGGTGRVLACDMQQDAIIATRELCRSTSSQLELHRGDHAQLLPQFLDRYSRQVGAVMFNLGYLPGGDKSLTTSPLTTGHALQTSVQLLRAKGILSVVAYVGHEGGRDEALVVERVLNQSVDDGSASIAAWPDHNISENSPRFYAIIKK